MALPDSALALLEVFRIQRAVPKLRANSFFPSTLSPTWSTVLKVSEALGLQLAFHAVA